MISCLSKCVYTKCGLYYIKFIIETKYRDIYDTNHDMTKTFFKPAKLRIMWWFWVDKNSEINTLQSFDIFFNYSSITTRVVVYQKTWKMTEISFLALRNNLKNVITAKAIVGSNIIIKISPAEMWWWWSLFHKFILLIDWWHASLRNPQEHLF